MAFTGYGQSILMEEDVNNDTVISETGRNKKHYVGLYTGYGIVLGDVADDTMRSLYKGKSLYIDAGLYYKRKFNQVYSLTGEFGYRLNVFSYKPRRQIGRVYVPPEKYYRLVISNVHAGFFNRINYGKRGNRIGYYVDIGATMDYGYINKLKTKYIDRDNDNHKSSKIVYSQLDYVNRLAYHGEVHVGFDKIVFTGSYRLSELLSTRVGYQLPPLVLGLRYDFGA